MCLIVTVSSKSEFALQAHSLFPATGGGDGGLDIASYLDIKGLKILNFWESKREKQKKIGFPSLFESVF